MPKLKNLYVISNGYFTDFILSSSESIKRMCNERKVKYHLSISIDGLGRMQDVMRGHEGAFTKAIRTCKEIVKEKKKYCDDFGVICTITRINVFNLVELDSYAKEQNLPIAYNVATIHKRLNNDFKYDSFSIFTDEKAQMMASEFLYSKFLETNSEMYFARYYYTAYRKRIAICRHRSSVVTLTPNGAISYCAVFSKELGNAISHDASSLFFDKANLDYKKELHKEYCESCSLYTESLSREGYKLFFKEIKRKYRW